MGDAGTAGVRDYKVPARLTLAFRDNDGFPIGVNTTPDTVSNGTVYGAYTSSDTVDVTLPSPNHPIVRRIYGGQLQTQDYNQAIDLPAISLSRAGFDETFHSYIKNVSVDTTTMSGWTSVAEGFDQSFFPPFVMILSFTITNRTGTNEYSHLFIPNCKVMLQGETELSQITSDVDNPASQNYQIIASRSTRDVTGRPFSGGNLGVEQEAYVRTRTSSLLALDTYVDDGSATEFTLSYKPTSSDTTGSADLSITEEGSTQSVTTVDTSTGAVTITAADAGDRWVVLYPTDFVSTS